MTSRKKIAHGIQVAQWLSWADSDYLAARGLFLKGFLLQGTILANTAIEKYLKAALVARNTAFGNTHDVVKLYERLKASGAVEVLSDGFLRVLGKGYSLRYPDRLPIGFNVSLALNKILTETDTTVYSIRKGFRFQNSNGNEVKMHLDAMVTEGNIALCDQNVAFGKADRAALFSKPTNCFELRVLDDGSVMQAEYQAGPLNDDHLFEQEGLRPS